MRLYIIRHGDPDYKNDSLTSRGKAEAQALAKYLPRLHLTHLYTSPLGRAKSTCAPCAERLGLPVEELPWVRELTGVYYEIEGIGKCAPLSYPAKFFMAFPLRHVTMAGNSRCILVTRVLFH